MAWNEEHSAAFEWAAWQFNRPEQGDGMIQAFRRDKTHDQTNEFRLHGLDPAATYKVSDLDGKATTTISGADLMQKGLHVEIADAPGATIIIYKRI